MATILQLNRIANNRSDAVSDTIARLQDNTMANAININPVHLPLGDTLPIVNGEIQAQPQAINLSDVHAFADANARNLGIDNADPANPVTIDWHEGDIAILATNADVSIPGPVTNTGLTVLLGGGNSGAEFRVPGGWNAADDEPANAAISAGSTIRFSNDGGTTFRGTGGVVDFLISMVRQQGPTGGAANNAIVTLNRVPAGTDGVDNGDAIFGAGADVLEDVSSGTWVFRGADASGVTTNDMWIRLEAPGTSAGITDLASIDGGSGPNRLVSIEYSASDSQLLFTDVRNTDNVTTVPLGMGGALLQSESPAITAATTTNVTFDSATTPTEIRSILPGLFMNAMGDALTEFPAKNTFMLFANGMKIVNSEIDITSNVLSFVTAGAVGTPNGIDLPATGGVVFELVTF